MRFPWSDKTGATADGPSVEVLPPPAPVQPRVVWCDHATALADVVTSEAPSRVLDGLSDLLPELRKPVALAVPETLLVAVADAYAPPATEVLPHQEVLDLIGAAALQSPAVAAVRQKWALDLPGDGPTAIVTVELADSAAAEELSYRALLLATQFAAIAPTGGAPFKRIVLAVEVSLEGVTKLTGSAPAVDLGFGTPIARRPYDVGRTLGALWAREEDDGPLERVRIVLAERDTGGSPTPEAAVLVAAMAAAAEQRGGAHVDVDAVEHDPDSDWLFIPVLGDDPAAAERTAVLLAPYLTGVGRLIVGWSQEIR